MLHKSHKALCSLDDSGFIFYTYQTFLNTKINLLTSCEIPTLTARYQPETSGSHVHTPPVQMCSQPGMLVPRCLPQPSPNAAQQNPAPTFRSAHKTSPPPYPHTIIQYDRKMAALHIQHCYKTAAIQRI